jgi:hypothetical protein
VANRFPTANNCTRCHIFFPGLSKNGCGRILQKISAPPPLMKAFLLIPHSARSISLDSNFNVQLTHYGLFPKFYFCSFSSEKNLCDLVFIVFACGLPAPYFLNKDTSTLFCRSVERPSIICLHSSNVPSPEPFPRVFPTLSGGLGEFSCWLRSFLLECEQCLVFLIHSLWPGS